MDFEYAAHPELEAQRAEDQRVGAFGQHGVTLCGNAVDLHFEPSTALSTAKDLHDSVTSADGRKSDVLPCDVVRQHGIGRVEVLVLQGIEEGLNGTGVVDVGGHWGSLVGHGCQPSWRPLWQGRPVRVAVVAGPDPG